MDRQRSLVSVAVCEWYGMERMPLRVLTREEEMEEFMELNPFLPECVWDCVNHDARLVFRWARDPVGMEIVVWNEESMSYRMIQDLCFKDSYETSVEWYLAIQKRIRGAKGVWVVFHGDDEPSAFGGRWNTPAHTGQSQH